MPPLPSQSEADVTMTKENIFTCSLACLLSLHSGRRAETFLTQTNPSQNNEEF